MQIQFSYKQVAEKNKKFLENYVNKKEARIKKFFSQDVFNNIRLEVRVEKYAKKEAYKVELFLNAFQEKFMASEDDHTVIEAFDIAFDKLIIQLRKSHERKIN